MRAAALFVFSLLLCASASAHRLNLFATATNGVISGNAYFSDDKPAKALKVVVFGADGSALGESITDDEGRFTFTVTSAGDVTLKAASSDGHAAEFVVTAAEISGSTTTPGATDTPTPVETAPADATLQNVVDEAVARHVRPLREQLDAYEKQVRLRDVVGGIGYIVGVVGLLAMMKARTGRGRS